MLAKAIASICILFTVSCAQPLSEANLRDRVTACLSGESVFGTKRWPADREMKVLIGGEDADVRLFRRSLLKETYEATMGDLRQSWSFTDDLDKADVFVVLAQDGKPASSFTLKMLSALYDGDEEKVAAAIPDVEVWEDNINIRMNINTKVTFTTQLTGENATSENAPTVDLPALFSTAKRAIFLKAESDTPSPLFARVSAFTAVIGLDTTLKLSTCEGYSGILKNGKGPSRQDRVVLELIS
ncbi:MAG: hypothetical protein ACPGGK_02875 [Pikeienuella sp.]